MTTGCEGPSPDLNAARGIVYSLIVGFGLWALIIAAMYFVIKWWF